MSLVGGTPNEVLAKILAKYMDDSVPHGWEWNIRSDGEILIELDEGGSIVQLRARELKIALGMLDRIRQ